MMPVRNNHIILRQVLELSLPPGENAFSLQQEIGTLVQVKLLPALEALFDRYASSDELIRIDRLEIDIGNLHLPSPGEAFVETTLKVLEEKLLSLINYGSGEIKRIPSVTNRFDQWLFFLEKGHLPWNAVVDSEKDFHRDLLKRFSSDQDAFLQLQQLLLKNPRALSRLVNQHPETFLVRLLGFITMQSHKKIIAFRDEISNLLLAAAGSRRSKDATREQLNLYHSFWEWYLLWALLHGRASTGPDTIIFEFLKKQILAQSTTFPGGESSLKRALLKTLRAGKGNFPLLFHMVDKIEALANSSQTDWRDPDSAEPHPVPEVQEGPDIFLSKDEKGIQETPGNKPSVNMQEDQALRNKTDGNGKPEETSSKTDEYFNEKPGVEFEADATTEKIRDLDGMQEDGYDDGEWILGKRELEQDRFSKDRHRSLKSPPDKENKKKDRSFNESEYPEGSGWYVHHAGIVLLHTYFKLYFKSCRLIKNDEFISDAARHKAVHLLQYLACGETGLPEYDLVLPKFLCGIPFEEPIPREMILTKKDETESRKLLQAAISHWTKLGKSSPEGLREAFLQRDGKLEKRPQGWYLTVEQKSIDILLDYLPWNLRMVKLPWMPELLRVEWG
jgi:hypothetical protein